MKQLKKVVGIKECEAAALQAQDRTGQDRTGQDKNGTGRKQ